MYSARRKWTQQGWRLFLLAAALGGAWYIRTYQSGAILELYGLLTRPFQGEETNLQEQLLADQRVRELQNRLSEVEYQNQQLKKQLLAAAPMIGGNR